jgi:hypothetical protein
MSTDAANAVTVLKGWSLRLMGTPPLNAHRVGVRRRAGSCPPSPADPAAQVMDWGAVYLPAAHPPVDFPEPKSVRQPCAVRPKEHQRKNHQRNTFWTRRESR